MYNLQFTSHAYIFRTYRSATARQIYCYRASKKIRIREDNQFFIKKVNCLRLSFLAVTDTFMPVGILKWTQLFCREMTFYIKYALMIFREALKSENFSFSFLPHMHGLVVTVGTDKNCTPIFIKFFLRSSGLEYSFSIGNRVWECGIIPTFFVFKPSHNDPT